MVVELGSRLPHKTPAQRLLDALGPVEHYRPREEYGDFGLFSGRTMEEELDPVARAGPISQIGPLNKVHAFWFAGMSCDGCSVAVTGAGAPSVESLLLGTHPGLPRVILHHPVINLESGPNFLRAHEQALRGELDVPYVIILEGSITDEAKAMETGGHWAGNGEEPWGPQGEDRPVIADEWIARLAPGAAAAIAIATCATWGGIPSANGNPTGAMSLMDFLGKDYRSAFGLPVVNVPGCAPIGDNFTETVAGILYFLQGFGPLPDFDELGRPAWLFGETVHRHCVRGAYYEEGTYAEEFGDPECLVEIGCWGPVVNCNITSRGAINHHGGCMNAGGACIGCTMPGFPDKFTPWVGGEHGSCGFHRQPRERCWPWRWTKTSSGCNSPGRDKGRFKRSDCFPGHQPSPWTLTQPPWDPMFHGQPGPPRPAPPGRPARPRRIPGGFASGRHPSRTSWCLPRRTGKDAAATPPLGQGGIVNEWEIVLTALVGVPAISWPIIDLAFRGHNRDDYQ